MFPIGKTKLVLVGFLIIISEICHAQTLKTVSALDSQYQKCLDEGINMRGCSIDYYNQMESLLNLAYNNLRKKLTPTAIAALKNEEIQWLKKRDVYFRKLEKEEERESGVKKEDWREMEYLSVYNDENNFINERVMVLIKRLNK